MSLSGETKIGGKEIKSASERIMFLENEIKAVSERLDKLELEYDRIMECFKQLGGYRGDLEIENDYEFQMLLLRINARESNDELKEIFRDYRLPQNKNWWHEVEKFGQPAEAKVHDGRFFTSGVTTIDHTMRKI